MGVEQKKQKFDRGGGVKNIHAAHQIEALEATQKNDNNCMLNFLDRMRVFLFTVINGCTCVCVSSASHFTDDIDMTYWSRLMT